MTSAKKFKNLTDQAERDHPTITITQYLEEQRVLDEQLAADYQELINELDASMSDYLRVLEQAFSPDIGVALHGSVELALTVGAAAEDVLDSEEKVLTYFLE